MTSPCDPEFNNKIDNVTSLDHFMVVQVDQILENQRLMLKFGVAVAQEVVQVLLIRRLVVQSVAAPVCMEKNPWARYCQCATM